MSITDLSVHALATYALWFVVSQGDIPGLKQTRDWLSERVPGVGRFLLCPMCSGFWCSALLAALPTTWPWSLTVGSVPGVVVKALAGAAACYLIELHATKREAR